MAMDLLDSLFNVLEHQLKHGNLASHREGLSTTVNLIKEQLDTANSESHKKLQALLLSHIREYYVLNHGLTVNTNASLLQAVRACLPLYSKETIWTIIRLTNIPQDVFLNLLISLSAGAENFIPGMEDDFLLLMTGRIEEMEEILSEDRIELAKKMGCLLRLLLPWADEAMFAHTQHQLMKFHRHSMSCTFIIFCAIIDCLLVESQRLIDYTTLLIKGITTKESMVRKQAIYIIKRMLDAFDKGTSDMSQCYTLSPHLSQPPLAEGCKADILSAWSDYILLIESLNEKQYHIVKPNLTQVDAILRSVQRGDLTVDWMFALFTRILNHDSMQVKRFGVLYILSLDYKQYPELISKETLPKLYGDFVVMTNQSPFFTRRPDHHQDVTPEVFTAMKSYLHNVMHAVREDNFKSVFLHGVIDTLAHSPWCPVPCMYWTAALASLDDPSLKGCWSEETLAIVLEIMRENFILCDRRIRRATYSYLLVSVLHLCQLTESTAPSTYLMISVLRSEGVCRYGSQMWNTLSSCLTSAINTGTISKEKALTSKCREEIAVMLYPPLSTDLCHWLSLTCEDILSTCNVRAYVSRERVIAALQAVLYVYELVLGTKASSAIEKLIEKYYESVSQYMLQLADDNVDMTSEEEDICIQYVRHCSVLGCRSFTDRLCGRLVKRQLVQTDLELRMVEVVLSLNKVDERFVLAVLDIPSERRVGLVASRTYWMAQYRYLQTLASDMLDNWTHKYSEAMDALSIFYREDSCVVFDCLRQVLPHLGVDEMEETSTVMLSKVEEESKNSHYLPLISSLVQTLFSAPLVNNVHFGSVLCQTFDSLYTVAEERPGVANIIARQFYSLISSQTISSQPLWLHCSLVKLSMYGPIHNKAHRTVEDAFLFLEEAGVLGDACTDEKRVGYSISDTEVRVLAVDTILYLLYNTTEDVSTCCHRVLPVAMDTYNNLLAIKCYSNFPNALAHRQRHRLLCLILCLLPACSLSSELRSMLLQFTLAGLKVELQPSCRHQLEWAYIYLMKVHPCLIAEEVIARMNYDKLVREKASYVCSLFCIAAHMCSLPVQAHTTADGTLSQLEVITQIVPLIVPWGMSSKFHMRIHAQAALLKIWQHSCDANLSSEISDCYPLFKANMDFALHSGTATEKNSRKLLEHFFYFKFDAVKDISIETIFTLWPRLLTLADGESIPTSLFDEFTRNVISESCYNIDLRTCDPGTWHVKVKEGDNETELAAPNLQKKITTWRTTRPDMDASLPDEVDRQDGLILVTSLIDKLPNLGGLCRTAEIFGAAEMVVSSLKILEDANFLSTSVTSHQWLPMKQVPSHCLSDYLMEVKGYGYTVVGAEQATNSKCLTDFQMPEKTVLLLGNEKQGLPADLIQLVDVCVEIPQQGVIRSLNVHVSGALLIWEYRKQRLLSRQTD